MCYMRRVNIGEDAAGPNSKGQYTRMKSRMNDT